MTTKIPQPPPVGFCPTCRVYLFEEAAGIGKCRNGHEHQLTPEIRDEWWRARNQRPVSPPPPSPVNSRRFAVQLTMAVAAVLVFANTCDAAVRWRIFRPFAVRVEAPAVQVQVAPAPEPVQVYVPAPQVVAPPDTTVYFSAPWARVAVTAPGRVVVPYSRVKVYRSGKVRYYR